jgi:hypothetical protein
LISSGLIITILTVGGLTLRGASSPIVGPLNTASPTLLSPGVSTTMLLTSLVSPTPTAGSVNLIRLNSPNTPATIVGIMHDDGANGDAVGGDGIYSLTVTLNEVAQGTFALESSASFKGVLKRVISAPLYFTVSTFEGTVVGDLTAGGDQIVLARIVSQNGLADVTGKVVTDTTVNIETVLRGAIPKPQIVIRTPGGTLDGEYSSSPGSPYFETGEEVVLILKRPDSQGKYSIPDLALGTFHVRNSAALGQIAVVDGRYDDFDGMQNRAPSFQSLIQLSADQMLPLAQLYTGLGIAH